MSTKRPQNREVPSDDLARKNDTHQPLDANPPEQRATDEDNESSENLRGESELMSEENQQQQTSDQEATATVEEMTGRKYMARKSFTPRIFWFKATARRSERAIPTGTVPTVKYTVFQRTFQKV